MSNKNSKIVVFLDNIGRIIIGKAVKQDADILSVENPSLVHIQSQPNTNQLQLQLLPLFFREFLVNKDKPTVWNFKQSNITISNDMDLNPQFLAQYEQAFGPANERPPQTDKKPEVVKLFDDEEEKK